MNTVESLFSSTYWHSFQFNYSHVLADTLLEELSQEQRLSRPIGPLMVRIAFTLPSIYFLGISLGFTQREVEEFEQSRPESVPEQALQMLTAWLERPGSRPTVKKLIKSMQESQISEELYRRAVLGFFEHSDSDDD